MGYYFNIIMNKIIQIDVVKEQEINNTCSYVFHERKIPTKIQNLFRFNNLLKALVYKVRFWGYEVNLNGDPIGSYAFCCTNQCRFQSSRRKQVSSVSDSKTLPKHST